MSLEIAPQGDQLVKALSKFALAGDLAPYRIAAIRSWACKSGLIMGSASGPMTVAMHL
jgi:hypothetical protein